jgi:hypothetical protein
MQIPDRLGDEEVVILDFSVEVVGRNVEDDISSVEVEMNSVALGTVVFHERWS